MKCGAYLMKWIRIILPLLVLIFLLFGIFAGIYGFKYLPPGVISFEAETPSDGTFDNIPAHYSYFPMIMFLILQFCTSIGVSSVPNMLISEMFPFKWVDLGISGWNDILNNNKKLFQTEFCKRKRCHLICISFLVDREHSPLDWWQESTICLHSSHRRLIWI